ncbi:hypothetical protein SLEP1_g4908 [Rubroshorea leprosula]|uniref:Ribosomal protein S18 n=1 Tax=Rubroshorea leprosula TaxID=152421 RepID=A0AAV5HY26_9ROSI|nr:hypothetical protein SLEP1_g4908 [Rubroshorea leprosula]
MLAFNPTSRIINNITTSETKQAKVNRKFIIHQSLSNHQDNQLNFK